ncbi:ankyrin repeat domain-containing protein [Actinocrispum sp. NPDC049592]|uniref:ankyrin repeat domain-containing protein n=1 Tax=Actinocrispum sp. NPDC049592 TaxID=3154835 RepID=UPI0034496BE7
MVSDAWHGMGHNSWRDLDLVRSRLAEGADPDQEIRWSGSPLQLAAESGSAYVVAELAARVRDVDVVYEGRTALWRAVYANQPDNARALVAAGADPAREMMAGWSPQRLALAGPHRDLFGGAGSLSEVESSAVVEAERLNALLADAWNDGLGLACVAGIDAAEAVRRLEAVLVPPYEQDEDGYEWADYGLLVMWATDVPGGCVVAQPWGYQVSAPGVVNPLSVGTKVYGLYANPKSGNQGSVSWDGETTGWDLHPGGPAAENDSAEEVLLSYLYQHEAVGYCCAYTGLRLPDTRAISGPPDVWLRLPDRDYWH